MAIKRERLIHPLFIALFGGAAGLAGALLLTQENLVERVKKEPLNALSVAYLEAWLRIRSDDMELRSLLASQYVRSGRIQEAEPLIAGLINSTEPGAKQKAVQLQMDLLEQQMWALDPADPQREVMLAELATLLSQSSELTWSAPALKVLAVRAKMLDQQALSAQFFKRLAKIDPTNSEQWRGLSVDESVSEGRYVEAAQAAFERQKTAPTIALQRENFLRAMAILESGNLLNLALKEASARITPALKNDPLTLRVLIRMALSANRPDLARDYAQRLLNMPQASENSDQKTGLHQVARYAGLPVSRVNDYGSRTLRWVYLDGIEGNNRRARLDANAQSVQHGVVRVSTAVAEVAASKSVKPSALLAKDSSGSAAPDDSSNDYELTYTVFLADRQLELALKVIGLALQRNPTDSVWLKRRAMVNEWAGHPAVALQAWLILARRTGSKDAWQAVERLSIGLNDDVIYLEALRQHVGGSRDELMYVDQIVATYERIGDSDQALAFLKSHIGKSKLQQDLLERYASLAERIGNDNLALQTWLRLNARFGPRSSYALKIANIYSAQGKFDKGMQVLVSAQNNASPTDYLYWRTLSNTATRVGRDDVARVAARHLLGSKDLSESDLLSMVDLWNAYPIDAGRIAEESFRRSGNILALQQAVYQYSRARAWVRIDTLLASLTPEQEAQANQSSEFLMAKAEFLRQTGKSDISLDTLRAAIALESGASDVRAAYLWLLIDRGSDEELWAALQRWRSDAEEDSQLWGPYAAGYLRLSEMAASLHFFGKEKPSRYQDPLWALTYAEALETFGYPDAAWTLRRQAWLEISKRRETLIGKSKSAQSQSDRANPVTTSAIDNDALLGEDDSGRSALRAQAATLAQPYAGGDYSRSILLQVLRDENLNQDVPATSTLTELDASEKAATAAKTDGTVAPSRMIAQDVALAWALSNEPYELAREWMAQRYGTELERPVYAEVAVALAMDDRKELDRLLEQNPDRIPVLSRIDANRRMDRWHEAQRIAFQGASGNPLSEELDAAVREFGLMNANYIEVGNRRVRQSPINITESDVEVGLRLSDRWTLTLNALTRQQRSVVPTALVNVPEHDRQLLAGIGWEDSDASLRVAAGRRQAVRDFMQARFEAAWNKQSALSWSGSLGYNQEATDSAELRIGGVKDTASLGALWRFGTREFVGARIDGNRFYDQDRRDVGTGHQLDLEAGYNIRLEYPDFTIRTVYSRVSYSPTGDDAGPIFANLSPDGVATTTEIMPLNFTQKGVLFSFGTDLITNYTRAWRPFMELGYLHDSRNGWGSTGRVGLAGSIFGNDHAVIYYAHERSARSVDGGTPATELGLRYRWYF